ncbi:hypothetical protein GFS31_18010 [Leptolyngbya sp. BL0902]|uniref:Ycf66 family protein n=1 Tax=Leptolyngbya sp. BL0902 TaxID=1115757 RepID=UPI0018E8D862|nr:Ycf66 family protein [Leptolyngbya sp. BL0902]QQE65116.1 hypothetical protein GFS31_18010 [Leptolyngbya sp. BL0902]
MVAQLLSGALAGIVGLGSVALYLAAFFFPEVHRRHDFFWSGVGCFYALILWLDAGQITPTELLGHLASISLMGWLGWQTLTLRRKRTPISQQTPYTADSWPTFRREMTALGLDALRQTPLRRWLPDPNPAEPSGIKGIRVSALKDVGYEFVDSVEPPEPAAVAKVRALPRRVRDKLVQDEPVQANPVQVQPVQDEPVQDKPVPSEPAQDKATQDESETLTRDAVISDPIAGEPSKAAAIPGDAAPATPDPESPPKDSSRQDASQPASREQVEQRVRVSRPTVPPPSPQRQPSLKQPLARSSPTPSPAASRSGGKSSTASPRGTMTLGQRVQGLTTWVQDLVRAKTAPKPKRAVIEIPPRPSSLAKRPDAVRNPETSSSTASSSPDSSVATPKTRVPSEPAISSAQPSQSPAPPRTDYPAPESSNWDDDDEDWV